jgi:hypothetical protein
MAGMKQVKTAIGKNQTLALTAKLVQKGLQLLCRIDLLSSHGIFLLTTYPGLFTMRQTP